MGVPYRPLSAKDTYVCGTCDDKRVIALPLPNAANSKHKLSHPLVRIFDSEPIPDARSVTTDLNFTRVERQLSAMEKKFERRFALLEAILSGIGNCTGDAVLNANENPMDDPE
jgi:hypothetical protein